MSKPTKRPPNPPKPPSRGGFRGGHSGSGSGRRGSRIPSSRGASRLNTDLSLPLPLPQSNLVGKKLQKINGSFLTSKEATEFHYFKATFFPNSDILPSDEHLSSGRRGPVATRQRGSGTYKTRSTGVLLSDFSSPEKKPGN